MACRAQIYHFPAVSLENCGGPQANLDEPDEWPLYGRVCMYVADCCKVVAYFCNYSTRENLGVFSTS